MYNVCFDFEDLLYNATILIATWLAAIQINICITTLELHQTLQYLQI